MFSGPGATSAGSLLFVALSRHNSPASIAHPDGSVKRPVRSFFAAPRMQPDDTHLSSTPGQPDRA